MFLSWSVAAGFSLRLKIQQYSKSYRRLKPAATKQNLVFYHLFNKAIPPNMSTGFPLKSKCYIFKTNPIVRYKINIFKVIKNLYEVARIYKNHIASR